MDDLVELNLRMAQHQIGDLDDAHRAYVLFSTGCLAQLQPSAADLKRFIAQADGAHTHENPIAVMSLNREYLNYARLVAKDIVSGQTEKLVTLGMNWEQVEIIAGLSNQTIKRIALHWKGLVYEFSTEIVACGARLHPAAARIHAAAF